MSAILHVFEHILNDELAAIGLDDTSIRPLFPIGDEDGLAQISAPK